MSVCTPDGVCVPAGGAAAAGVAAPASSASPAAGAAAAGDKRVALQVQVISDTMCPWCHVGSEKLKLAMKAASDRYTFEVEWLPFFLRESLPEEGMTATEYFRTQYGSASMVDGAYARLKEAGAEVGIGFKAMVKGRLLKPTVRSHALIDLAGRQGKQYAMVDRIFKLYYEEGGALNSVDDLVRCADEVGVEGAREHLADKSNIDLVRYKAQQYRSATSGVPFFIVSRADGEGRKFAVSGAVPPEHLAMLMERAEASAAQ